MRGPAAKEPAAGILATAGLPDTTGGAAHAVVPRHGAGACTPRGITTSGDLSRQYRRAVDDQPPRLVPHQVLKRRYCTLARAYPQVRGRAGGRDRTDDLPLTRRLLYH